MFTGATSIPRAAMAFDENGHILAMRCESTQTYGAYSNTFAPVILMHVMPDTLVGMYKVPVGYLRINGVFTHTSPGRCLSRYQAGGRLSA